MGKYHSNRGPVEGCPAPDGREIKSNSLVYVQQRPSRRAFAGSPFGLRSQEEQAAEQERIARLVPGWTP